MHSFLSKVFGRKKDGKDNDPNDLLDGKFEAVSPNVSPNANTYLELDTNKADEGKGKAKENPGFSFFKAKSRPSSPEVNKRVLDTLPHLSLNFDVLKATRNYFDSDLEAEVLLSDAVIGERRLNPFEALVLIRACSQAITSRGLETLGIMTPHWYSASPDIQRRLISQFIHSLTPKTPATALSATTHSPASNFESEINFTRSPHDIAAVLRWGLRHLQLEGESFGTDDGWYKTFLDAEAAGDYPPNAFSTQLAPKLPGPHLELLTATLEIFSSLAALAESNGTSGSKLSKIFGLWLLTARRVDDKDDWATFYARWEQTGRMLEHLFLARIRDESSDIRMPTRLLELVRKYPYTQGLSSPTTDLQLLPRPRLTTPLHDALFVRVDVEITSWKRRPTAKTHPLTLIADAFSITIEEGEYAELWKKIITASKSGSNPSPLSDVFADETIRFLSLVPHSKGHDTKSPTFSIASPSSHAKLLSFDSEADKSAAPVSSHKKAATEPPPATPLSPLPIGGDWAQFSTSGFFDVSPGIVPLASTLLDADIEKTTPAETPSPVTLSRRSSRHVRIPSTSRRKSSVDTPRAISNSSSVDASSDEATEAETDSRPTIKASKVDMIQLDEAFIDFWSDALLDPISSDWPTFIVCKFKSNLVPELTYGPEQKKTLTWLVLEQVYSLRPPAPSTPVENFQPSSPGAASTSGKKRFSFWSVSRTPSTSSVGSLKAKKGKTPKVGEMGELIEEEVKEEDSKGAVKVKASSPKYQKSQDVSPTREVDEPVVKKEVPRKPVPDIKPDDDSTKAVAAAAAVAVAAGGAAAILSAVASEETSTETKTVQPEKPEDEATSDKAAPTQDVAPSAEPEDIDLTPKQEVMTAVPSGSQAIETHAVDSDATKVEHVEEQSSAVEHTGEALPVDSVVSDEVSRSALTDSVESDIQSSTEQALLVPLGGTTEPEATPMQEAAPVVPLAPVDEPTASIVNEELTSPTADEEPVGATVEEDQAVAAVGVAETIVGEAAEPTQVSAVQPVEEETAVHEPALPLDEPPAPILSEERTADYRPTGVAAEESGEFVDEAAGSTAEEEMAASTGDVAELRVPVTSEGPDAEHIVEDSIPASVQPQEITEPVVTAHDGANDDLSSNDTPPPTQEAVSEQRGPASVTVDEGSDPTLEPDELVAIAEAEDVASAPETPTPAAVHEVTIDNEANTVNDLEVVENDRGILSSEGTHHPEDVPPATQHVPAEEVPTIDSVLTPDEHVEAAEAQEEIAHSNAIEEVSGSTATTVGALAEEENKNQHTLFASGDTDPATLVGDEVKVEEPSAEELSSTQAIDAEESIPEVSEKPSSFTETTFVPEPEPSAAPTNTQEAPEAIDPQVPLPSQEDVEDVAQGLPSTEEVPTAKEAVPVVDDARSSSEIFTLPAPAADPTAHLDEAPAIGEESVAIIDESHAVLEDPVLEEKSLLNREGTDESALHTEGAANTTALVAESTSVADDALGAALSVQDETEIVPDPPVTAEEPASTLENASSLPVGSTVLQDETPVPNVELVDELSSTSNAAEAHVDEEPAPAAEAHFAEEEHSAVEEPSQSLPQDSTLNVEESVVGAEQVPAIAEEPAPLIDDISEPMLPTSAPADNTIPTEDEPTPEDEASETARPTAVVDEPAPATPEEFTPTLIETPQLDVPIAPSNENAPTFVPDEAPPAVGEVIGNVEDSPSVTDEAVPDGGHSNPVDDETPVPFEETLSSAEDEPVAADESEDPLLVANPEPLVADEMPASEDNSANVDEVSSFVDDASPPVEETTEVVSVIEEIPAINHAASEPLAVDEPVTEEDASPADSEDVPVVEEPAPSFEEMPGTVEPAADVEPAAVEGPSSSVEEVPNHSEAVEETRPAEEVVGDSAAEAPDVIQSAEEPEEETLAGEQPAQVFDELVAPVEGEPAVSVPDEAVIEPTGFAEDDVAPQVEEVGQVSEETAPAAELLEDEELKAVIADEVAEPTSDAGHPVAEEVVPAVDDDSALRVEEEPTPLTEPLEEGATETLVPAEATHPVEEPTPVVTGEESATVEEHATPIEEPAALIVDEERTSPTTNEEPVRATIEEEPDVVVEATAPTVEEGQMAEEISAPATEPLEEDATEEPVQVDVAQPAEEESAPAILGKESAVLDESPALVDEEPTAPTADEEPAEATGDEDTAVIADDIAEPRVEEIVKPVQADTVQPAAEESTPADEEPTAPTADEKLADAIIEGEPTEIVDEDAEHTVEEETAIAAADVVEESAGFAQDEATQPAEEEPTPAVGDDESAPADDLAVPADELAVPIVEELIAPTPEQEHAESTPKEEPAAADEVVEPIFEATGPAPEETTSTVEDLAPSTVEEALPTAEDATAPNVEEPEPAPELAIEEAEPSLVESESVAEEPTVIVSEATVEEAEPVVEEHEQPVEEPVLVESEATVDVEDPEPVVEEHEQPVEEPVAAVEEPVTVVEQSEPTVVDSDPVLVESEPAVEEPVVVESEPVVEELEPAVEVMPAVEDPITQVVEEETHVPDEPITPSPDDSAANNEPSSPVAESASIAPLSEAPESEEVLSSTNEPSVNIISSEPRTEPMPIPEDTSKEALIDLPPVPVVETVPLTDPTDTITVPLAEVSPKEEDAEVSEQALAEHSPALSSAAEAVVASGSTLAPELLLNQVEASSQHEGKPETIAVHEETADVEESSASADTKEESKESEAAPEALNGNGIHAEVDEIQASEPAVLEASHDVEPTTLDNSIDAEEDDPVAAAAEPVVAADDLLKAPGLGNGFDSIVNEVPASPKVAAAAPPVDGEVKKE